MDIRLIAVDMDGTLLNSKKELTERSLNTLREAHNHGILVVPSTGRMAQGLPEYIKQLSFVRYIITINGGVVWDLQENVSLHEANIPYERAIEVMEFVQKYDAINDCYCNGEAIMDRRFMDLIDYHIPDALAAVIRRSRKLVDGYIDFMRNKHADIQKIQMFFHDNEKRLAAIQELTEAFPELTLACSQTFNIELNAASANKGNALTILCRQLGIDIEKTMAFGDGGNDKAMLLAAGYAVAMENGTDDIKAVADYVTQSNDEDGVACAIEKLIFGA